MNLQADAVAVLHALWKPVASAEAIWWATSGSNLFHQVHDTSSARQFAVSGALAGGVAVLTGAEKYAKQLLPRLTGGVVEDMGTGSTLAEFVAPTPASDPIAGQSEVDGKHEA